MNDDLNAQLQSLEEELLRPDVRRNSARVAELLADDFREFGASGRIFDKASILRELSDESPARLSLSDFACRQIAPDAVLVTYRSTRSDRAGERTALRSSLWLHRDGRWQLLFHQGTRE